ncbi:hypothetical protein E2C01_079763 [Portunus trituberculatus]|uniref:Uncharacterized protein n=1 Tax=Portunus trituberculatus TaxID=210409 RepID=A0A5B7IRD5_PORTR|nr:hypothetical protein [Portunus trituberculatus]
MKSRLLLFPVRQHCVRHGVQLNSQPRISYRRGGELCVGLEDLGTPHGTEKKGEGCRVRKAGRKKEKSLVDDDTAVSAWLQQWGLQGLRRRGAGKAWRARS